MSLIRFEEQAEPATPPSGKAVLYVDSADGEVSIKDDTGTVKKFISAVPKFVSADQTITSGGTLTLPHGLPVTPSAVILELICQNATNGYSPGDRPTIHSGVMRGNNTGTSITKDGTNIYVTFGSSATVFDLVNKTTGGSFAAINTNWKLRITAYAI